MYSQSDLSLTVKSPFSPTTVPVNFLKEIPITKWLNKSDREIEDEFEELNKIHQEVSLSSVALHPENANKNRYTDVIPIEQYRVHLKNHQDFDIKTDYINASYICDSFAEDDQRNLATPINKCKYIASQGPLFNTALHFWLMVWENSSPVIVMLTSLNENGRSKCNRYWPRSIGEKGKLVFIGPSATLTIICQNEALISHGKIIHRSFELIFQREIILGEMNTDKRTIQHFQYLSWPDRKCPDNTSSGITKLSSMAHQESCGGHLTGTIYHLIKLVHQSRLDSPWQGPSVIHCSAGIGRTGTFIAIDQSLYFDDQRERNLKCQKTIFELVKNMRECRPCMVQTIEQYKFIYQALIYLSEKQKPTLRLLSLSAPATICRYRPANQSVVQPIKLPNLSSFG